MPTTQLNRRMTAIYHALSPQDRCHMTMKRLVELAGGTYWF